MMRAPLRALGWSLNALGVAVTITLAVWPDARKWFLDHAGLGWSLVILLGIATAVLGQVVYFERQAHSATLDRERHDHSATLAREREEHEAAIADLKAKLPSDNDARLLAEWLDGWTQDGDFVRFLSNGFIGFMMPLATGMQIANRLQRWSVDKRQLADPILRQKFQAVFAATKEFREATGEMWLEGLGEERVLEVPNEWKDSQRKRYDTAVDALDAGCTSLYEALTDLFAAMHERGLPT